MDPNATNAVTAMKEARPRTVGEVRRLMGLLGVYRRHIKKLCTNSKANIRASEPWSTERKENYNQAETQATWWAVTVVVTSRVGAQTPVCNGGPARPNNISTDPGIPRV